MSIVWMSACLLALTGWQAYRLGKEYGWWDNSQPASRRGTTPAPDGETEYMGLGRTKTDVTKLLRHWQPADTVAPVSIGGEGDQAESDEPPVMMPTTTLQQLHESPPQAYPPETDQIPQSCSWLDEEAMSLVSAHSPAGETSEPVVPLTEYVKRVATVQRRLSQLSRRRTAANTFTEQDLRILIDSYQLTNDQALDWLIEQHEQPGQPDYGALFDELESKAK